MVIIAIPLAVISRTSIQELERQELATAILEEELGAETGHVVDVHIEGGGKELVVVVTLYALVELDARRLTEVQQRLAAEVGAPVTLRATVLQARQLEVESSPYPMKVGDGAGEEP